MERGEGGASRAWTARIDPARAVEFVDFAAPRMGLSVRVKRAGGRACGRAASNEARTVRREGQPESGDNKVKEVNTMRPI